MEVLFAGSIVFIYLFAFISIMNYAELNNKQKVSIMYLLTYGFQLTHSTISPIPVGILFLGALFLYEEYWNKDSAKNTIMGSLLCKILDFITQLFFVYKGIVFGISLWLIDNDLFLLFGNRQIIISVVLLFITIHLMFTSSVEFNTYTDILNKIERTPYYCLIENEIDNDGFYDRLNLLVDVEDKYFFERDGYTFASLDYISLYLRDHDNSSYIQYTVGDFINKWGKEKKLREKLKLIKKGILYGYKWWRSWLKAKIEIIKRVGKNLTVRGHSTIEMQLFRTFIYKRGIEMGRPRNLQEWYKTIKRKLFELIFTPFFWKGLKKYLSHEGVVNLNYFREYILYLYCYNVIAWFGGKRYFPMAKLYEKKAIAEWELEMFFIEILGLSKRKITQEKIALYKVIIEKYGLDKNKIFKYINS